MTYLLSQEVKEALKNNSPVVALESTIITHGMPYPENVAMARSVEDDPRRRRNAGNDSRLERAAPRRPEC